MKKLHEILSHLRKVDGDVGVEVEVEGNNLKHVEDANWHSEPDGSLRGENQEYVFNKPLPVNKAVAAIKSLANQLKDYGSELKFSFRTSVHVHVNCMELTYAQYLNYIYLYLLLEEPLMTFCGKERKGNRFCLRLQDAEGILDYLNMVFKSYNNLGVVGDGMRYAAVNLAATVKYGSLEFRAMRGTLDVDVLTTWIETLVQLRTYATKLENPQAVFDLFVELGAVGFMQEVLGEKLTPSFMYPKASGDIQRSFSISLDLPYAYLPEKPKATKKDMYKAEWNQDPEEPAPRAVRPAVPGLMDAIRHDPARFIAEFNPAAHNAIIMEHQV